jgi:hypothetical protein
MIKINLLPLDKRKTERTPLKGAGLMIADALVIGVFVVLIIISLLQISVVRSNIEEQKKTLDSLQEAVREHDKLKADVSQLERDLGDLEKVTGTRPFEWSVIFDALWDVIHKHKRVWVDSMELADGKQMENKFKQMDPKANVANFKYGIVLRCHVGGLDLKSMTAFRRDLREHPTLARYFPSMNFDVQYSTMEQKDFTEKWSIDFEVFLVNSGQTDKNTSPAAAATRSR